MKYIFFPKTKKQKRKAIEKEALEELRRVRQSFEQQHPGVLGDLKRLYQATQKVDQKQDDGVLLKAAAMQKTTRQDEVPIDRAKNMDTIAKFLQITNSEKIKKALRDQLL